MPWEAQQPYILNNINPVIKGFEYMGLSLQQLIYTIAGQADAYDKD